MSNIVNLDDARSTGRPVLRSGQYSVRATECEKQTSKKQNPMLTFKYEIVAPDSITDNEGRSVAIKGLGVTDWVVLNENGFPKLKSIHKLSGLPMTIDVEKPNTKQYVGKAFKVQLVTEASVVKDENTGEPMLDDEGKPITTNNYKIVRFISADTEFTMPSDSVAF